MDADITILLAIHNGAKYLAQQLDSLQHQSYQQFHILAYDDHSSDRSQSILKSHPLYSRCTLLPASNRHLGAKGAFARLMDAALHSSSRYFAFCDQDDYWQPQKLERLLARLSANGDAQPRLIHSDMTVCDAALNPLAASYMRYTGNRHEAPQSALKTLLNKNFVSGCTVLCNRELLELATPVPAQAYMHDWWLALIAAASGEILFEDAALILYRQHRDNAIGAQTHWSLLQARLKLGIKQLQRQFLATCTQAGCAAARLQDKAEEPIIRILNNYAELATDSRWQRLQKLFHGCCLHRRGFYRLIFISQLLLTPRN